MKTKKTHKAVIRLQKAISNKKINMNDVMSECKKMILAMLEPIKEEDAMDDTYTLEITANKAELMTIAAIFSHGEAAMDDIDQIIREEGAKILDKLKGSMPDDNTLEKIFEFLSNQTSDGSTGGSKDAGLGVNRN